MVSNETACQSADNSSPYGTEETRYHVDGFRSLRGFEIGLNQGLNVLVGPNGSGKTNFIEFLDFLGTTLIDSASTAVSQAGGVARVFSIEQSKSKSSRINATISGVADINPYAGEEETYHIFNFEYELEVKFSRTNSAVFISKEIIRFKKLRHSHEQALCNSSVGTIAINRRAIELDQPPKIEISPRLQANNIRNPLRINSRYFGSTEGKIVDPRLLGQDESLLAARLMRPAIDAVRHAITRGRSFNLIPSIVRTPDDLTRMPSISSDGSGLTSTLYHLQQATRPPRRTRSPVIRRRLLPEHLEAIIDWTKLVLPEMEAIAVSADPHTGKYLGYLIMDNQGLRIPLQSASDGTLKWLALVTLIVTRGGAYSIEEPENFLHPKMQQYLIELIRDYAADEGRPGYFIVSTHSETIINRCSPEELVLFEFSEGATSCHRLRNGSAVLDQINQTGFGLGYYYANNALS